MDELDKESLKNRAVKGIFALTSRTFILQMISLISFSLLTYFLSPKTIGIFGAAVAATKIFTLFTDIGFGAALIQKKDNLTQEDLKTTFTLQEILVGLVVIIGLILSRGFASYFGLSNQGLWLLRALIVILFVSSLKTIPSILLERKIQFEKQILPQIAEAIVFNLMVVILAMKGFEVTSFTWAFLVSSLISLPIYYFLAPWKIEIGINKHVAKRILSFGTPYQVKSILGVIKDDLIKLYATKTVGFQGVGFLEWGQRWAFSPFRFLVDSVTKVTFPTFARIQEEKQILKKALESSLFAVSTVMFPVMVGMTITAKYFINMIPKYGKWEESLPILYFFCLNATISSLSNILVNVLDATGRVKTTLILMVIWTVLTWILTPVGILFLGATGVAAVSALITFTIVLTVYLVKTVIVFDFLSCIKKPLFLSISMLFITYLERTYLGISFPSLVLIIISGMIVYGGGMWLIARNELQELFAIVRKTHE